VICLQESFHVLLARFSLTFEHAVAGGRPRSLSAADMLGLVLVYMSASLTHKQLQLIFGITPAVCSRELNRGITALLQFVLSSIYDMMLTFNSQDASRDAGG
jgi:hypothetical protein